MRRAGRCLCFPLWITHLRHTAGHQRRAPTGHKRAVLPRAWPSALSSTKCSARTSVASKGAGERGSRVSSTWSPQTTPPAPGEHTNAYDQPQCGDQPRLPPQQQHHPGASAIESASTGPNTARLAPRPTTPQPDRPPSPPCPPGLTTGLKHRSQRTLGDRLYQGRAPWQPSTAPTSISPPRFVPQAVAILSGA